MAGTGVDLRAMVAELAARDRGRTEATIQSKVHLLLTAAPLDLGEAELNEVVLESPVGDRRRIDVEVGATVIEIKKDLRLGTTVADATAQLAGYVEYRSHETGTRYVGILTDGCEWHAFHLAHGELSEVAHLVVDAHRPDVDGLIAWLDGVMATRSKILPTHREITEKLGVNSPGHRLDHADLRVLYEANRTRPAIAIKRELWAKLLTTALGTQFPAGDDGLFIEHTLLVATAEAVAHAVVGFDITAIGPASLLGGDLFSRQAQILGVVEHDFFDWPLDCGDDGKRWVASMARRLARFSWEKTDHDAMKTIYESVITAETRKRLGEYYTPDFLAERMVGQAVSEPLQTRVLDPACGSGTFLFHAIRNYRRAASAAEIGVADTVLGITSHVMGIDLHPVAATLARVTYLLAIGPDLLQSEDRPEFRVPVYLGDSLQWGQRGDLFSSETLSVATDDGAQLFADQLRFPSALLDDADRFDRLVAELADLAAGRAPGSPHPAFAPIARRHGLSGPDRDTVEQTFEVMCRLHDQGRDHIWSYFVRNLARPAWLSRPANRVTTLVGNPPWLAYRFMTAAMQARYKEMTTDRRMWTGGSVATQQDLSDLFVARAVEQYLAPGGHFTFVMPAAVLDRGQYGGFRSAVWNTQSQALAVEFGRPWDLSKVYPYFFPRTSAVVHGRRCLPNESAAPLPTAVERWTGSIPNVDAPWSEVEPHLTRVDADVRPRATQMALSPYKDRFTNGATIFPRVLTTVTALPAAASPLGTGRGRRAVKSFRGTYEKKPWKDLPDLEGVIEAQFVFPIVLGENVLPFLLLPLASAVLPVTNNGKPVPTDEFPGLDDWWSRASRLWEQGRSSTMTLAENVDYRRKLTNQFPIPRHRVVVAHSAMHVTACRMSSEDAVVEHQLDWAACRSEDEALYLCAVLNSTQTTELATPHMTSGKGGGRHIGKSLWHVPIPLYDPDSELHRDLTQAGRAAEALVSAEILPDQTHGALRRRVRSLIASSEVGSRINELVATLLPPSGT